MKNFSLIVVCVLLLALPVKKTSAALLYSKIEFAGCPENAFCQKNTGEVRQKWLDQLALFYTGKLSENAFNEWLQKNQGVPFPIWALEEASVLPNIMLWDSPCAQHRKEASKFYIGDIFRKNIKENEIKEFQSLFFAKAYGVTPDKKVYSVTIPRSEVPLFSENGKLYFLEEDEGNYYGLYISINGDIKISGVHSVKETAKESVCLKEQVDQFLREAPSPTFYKGYTCKDIWDKSLKAYRPMLFGWSCH